ERARENDAYGPHHRGFGQWRRRWYPGRPEDLLGSWRLRDVRLDRRDGTEYRRGPRGVRAATGGGGRADRRGRRRPRRGRGQDGDAGQHDADPDRRRATARAEPAYPRRRPRDGGQERGRTAPARSGSRAAHRTRAPRPGRDAEPPGGG